MNDSFLVRPSIVPAGVCALHSGFSICDKHSKFYTQNPQLQRLSNWGFLKTTISTRKSLNDDTQKQTHQSSSLKKYTLHQSNYQQPLWDGTQICRCRRRTSGAVVGFACSGRKQYRFGVKLNTKLERLEKKFEMIESSGGQSRARVTWGHVRRVCRRSCDISRDFESLNWLDLNGIDGMSLPLPLSCEMT